MSHSEEFEKQLELDDERVVYELFHNPDKAALRDFYIAWFDEISALIANSRSLRTVVEDICNLEPTPAIKSLLMEEHLFVYLINVAIKNGVLTKEQIIKSKNSYD